MHRILGAALAILFAFTATGCIETQMLVTVNKDGSGTVEERMLMNKMMVGMLKGMSESMQAEGAEGEGTDNKTAFALGSKKELEERAAEMGEGVTLQSFEEVETSTGTGYNAFFTFKDINSLQVDQNPGSSMPSMPGEEEAQSESEMVMFQFTPGSPARLVITPPTSESEGEETVDDEDEYASDEDDEGGEGEGADMMGGFEQMKEFFRGMRLNIAVKVNGSIRETNAQFVDGSTITLMDFDFDKLLDHPEAMKKLEASESMSPAAAQEVLKDIPGIKFDIAEEISVVFD